MKHPPMMDMLESLPGRLSLHMPGHKGRPLPYDLPLAWDLTELPNTDDLYAPGAGIAQAQEALALSAHAGHSLLLTGGSTAGILAMVLYAVPPGGKLLVSRSAHHSVQSACILGDVRPQYVWPHWTEDGLAFHDLAQWEAAMDAHPDAAALLITAPDYFGMAMPLQALALAARQRGMKLLVDQAHGAHWNWWDQPQDAGRQGADLWVQSAHKTLPVPTGGAWLHLAPGEDVARARSILRMVQSSSPSFALMAALDQARAWMDAQGTEALSALQDLLQGPWPGGFRNAQEAWAGLPLEMDPTRLVLDCMETGFTGWAVAQNLAKLGVDVEMADHRRIVCIFTVADGPRQADALAKALDQIGRKARDDGELSPSEGAMIPAPARPTHQAPQSRKADPKEPDTSQSMGRDSRLSWKIPHFPPAPKCLRSPRTAALGPQEPVPLEQAVGRIAATAIGAYPPGIPLIAPGEAISPEALHWLEQIHAMGGTLFGIDSDTIRCSALPGAGPRGKDENHAL